MLRVGEVQATALGRKSQGPGTVGAEEASACVDASVEVSSPSQELAIPQQLAVQIQEGH